MACSPAPRAPRRADRSRFTAACRRSTASRAYDPCYHQACDSLDPIADGADAELYEALNDAYDGALEYNGVISNINTLALEEMSDAVAHAVLLYAMSTSSVSGTGQASERAAVASGGPARRALQALTL